MIPNKFVAAPETCVMSMRIDLRNRALSSLKGVTPLGLSIGARIIEAKPGLKVDPDKIEALRLETHLRSTSAIAASGAWATRQNCVACDGAVADPTTGIIYCGQEVPENVQANIARHFVDPTE